MIADYQLHEPAPRLWEHRYEGTTVWFGLSTDEERAEMEAHAVRFRITIEWRLTGEEARQ